MNKTVTVTRNMRGELEAKNQFNMKAPGRMLELSTYKCSGGLVTRAQVGIYYRSEGSTSGFVGFKMNLFGDFSKRLEVSKARGTEKAIFAQQSRILGNIEAILAEAEAYCEANPGKCNTLEKGEIDAREGVEGPLVVMDVEGDTAKAIAAVEAGALYPLSF